MVRAAKEDNLFELAAQAGGKEDDAPEKGLSLQPIFLGPEPGRVNDEGFETRVKTPDKSASQTSPRKTESVPEKKTVGRPRGTASDRSIAEVQDAIQQKFDEAFAVVSIGLPVTGTYGVENSEKAVKALISIAKRRPKLLKALLKVADGADGIEIGRYMLGIGVALQVDMGRMQPDALPARVTGVTEVVQKYFIEPEGGEVNPNVTEQTTHARFQPIS